MTKKREYDILISMAVPDFTQQKIAQLKTTYDLLRPGKDALLTILDEAEVAESVYNSNAIENSTLTLKETEKILFDEKISRDVELHEVFEAKNLGSISAYIRDIFRDEAISRSLILKLHHMLLTNIDNSIAGRFRADKEYVRVGSYIAPDPKEIDRMIDALLIKYSVDSSQYFIETLAEFHLNFERIHPFLDGNGRIGRIIMNFQLFQRGYPGIIIRDKEKYVYYDAFKAHTATHDVRLMEKVLSRALTESLHKRIAYLGAKEIIRLSDWVKFSDVSLSKTLNKAKRQSIPAFRENGVWKIASDFEPED